MLSGDLIITLMPICKTRRKRSRTVAKADGGFDVVGTVRQNRQTACFANRRQNH